MTAQALLLPIFIPLFAGAIVFAVIRKFRAIGEVVALSATLFNLLVALALFKHNLEFSLPWAGWGWEFSLRLYHFSAFINLAIALFGFLITLYSTSFMRNKPCLNQFYAYLLITLSFASGAVLADNLVVMLFFWEGLLLSLFGMIVIGNKLAFKTATKAFIIVGIADLCMMLGIILAGHLAGTLEISKISLPLDRLGSIAFILLLIGALAKSGAMPFHSWIPDAASDAPLPFMALVPAAFEKLLGIYFLARISLDMFKLSPGSWISTLLMVIGSITILLAVMMALIQKEYKRLLSYHAISQVGYMILGIGTAVPAGIVGGLFHMVNNALYKSGLFLTAGAVEKQAGTTDLEELGGIGAKMPVTFICFIICAVSISGVPPFNGFFSKELIYDGALERGLVFYLVAVVGSFFTAASFLKLGHAAFLGKLNQRYQGLKEVSFAMLLPMVALALFCIGFGLFNALPLKQLIQPILPEARLEGHNFSGFPANFTLIIISICVFVAAFLNHCFGVRRKGSALGAADHIHYAPVLSALYDKAEKKLFDPYNWGLAFSSALARSVFWCDRKIDWLYDGFSVKSALGLSRRIRKLHDGNYSTYLLWALAGGLLVVVFLMYAV